MKHFNFAGATAAGDKAAHGLVGGVANLLRRFTGRHGSSNNGRAFSSAGGGRVSSAAPQDVETGLGSGAANDSMPETSDVRGPEASSGQEKVK